MIDRVIMRSHPPFSLSFSCVCLWGGVISRNNQGVAFIAANLQDITRLTKFLRWKMPCPIFTLENNSPVFTLENNSPMRVLPLLP
jgi:lipoprotein